MSNRVKSTGIIVRVHLPAASTRQHLCCCCRFCCIGNLGSLWCFVVCILTYGRSAYWPRFSQPFSLGCQLSPQMALISGKLVTPPPPPPLTHLNTFTCVPHTYLVPLHQGKVRQFLSQILDKNIFFSINLKTFLFCFYNNNWYIDTFDLEDAVGRGSEEERKTVRRSQHRGERERRKAV